MFLSAVCDRTAKVQNFPDVTIGKSQNFPTLIYFSICTYSTCHMEGTPTASTKTDKLSESCKGSEHVTERTGRMFKDKRMGWMIIDDDKNEKQHGIYYYPLKALPEEYLTDGQPVVFSGELYPTWRSPWEDNDHSDNYYLDIDAIRKKQ